jgi:hypothetical protein
MRVLGNTLVFASNVLDSSACSIGGYGFINYVDSSNGGSVNPTASTVISEKILGGLIVGINAVWPKPTDASSGAITGLGNPKLIVTTSAGTRLTKDAKLAPVKAQGRRVSWRPLISP